MSTHENSAAASTDVIPEALRRAYNDNNIIPLWESVPAALFGKQVEEAQAWHWKTMGPIIRATGEIKAEHVLDRRVLLMTNPRRLHAWDEAATGQLAFDFQMLLPGERAAAHRHPMNALRFIVESSGGAKTIVDGKDCVMEPGDLIITPGWCWHEHVSEGKDPVIWLDVLDVPLHNVLGTTGFQPGPTRDVRPQLQDGAFVTPGIFPRLDGSDFAGRGYSPMYRYAWADAVRALEAAPVAADESRQVRYSNPLTGGPCMDLLDSTLLQLEVGKATRKYKSSASTVCYVVEGHGTSRIGDKTIEWSPRDVFTVPAHLWASHLAKEGPARVFQVSNSELYRRLGYFNEAFGE
ncbi:MAG: cupin domain-containing protein [Gallionella sp.]|nr:cupin domain-containing protein [Gallionella sp.]